MGVFPGRHQVRGKWVFPGRDWRCAEDGCYPHKSSYYVLDDYCINSA